jgi:hypothetical protein
MRGNVMFNMCDPKTPATLQNEVVLIDLGDKVFTAAARTKALLMIRRAAPLTEDKGASDVIIFKVVAGRAASKVSQSEFIIPRELRKRFSGPRVLLPFGCLALSFR